MIVLFAVLASLVSLAGLGLMILNWPMHLVSDRVGNWGNLLFLTGGSGAILTVVAALIAG